MVFMIFGTTFQFQGHGVIGPESSFMYQNPNWIDNEIVNLKETLESNNVPERNPYCENCAYIEEGSRFIATNIPASVSDGEFVTSKKSLW